MIVLPRPERIMVRIFDLDHPDAEPRIEPLARLGLPADDIEYIIKKWDIGTVPIIGRFRYERVHK